MTDTDRRIDKQTSRIGRECDTKHTLLHWTNKRENVRMNNLYTWWSHNERVNGKRTIFKTVSFNDDDDKNSRVKEKKGIRNQKWDCLSLGKPRRRLNLTIAQTEWMNEWQINTRSSAIQKIWPDSNKTKFQNVKYFINETLWNAFVTIFNSRRKSKKRTIQNYKYNNKSRNDGHVEQVPKHSKELFLTDCNTYSIYPVRGYVKNVKLCQIYLWILFKFLYKIDIINQYQLIIKTLHT